MTKEEKGKKVRVERKVIVSEKKACIFGLLFSFIYAVALSFGISSILHEISEVSMIGLFGFSFPIIFIIFATFAFALILLFYLTNKE